MKLKRDGNENESENASQRTSEERIHVRTCNYARVPSSPARSTDSPPTH